MSAVWPTTLWLVRHGESTGNLARIAAEETAASTITIAGRDVDVPLSTLGQRQSRALGAWFRSQPATEQPTVVLSSPYVRAQETARLLVEGCCARRELPRHFGRTAPGKGTRLPKSAHDSRHCGDIPRGSPPSGDVANCSITTFRAAPMGERPGFRLINYNFVTPIENAGEPVTDVPDIAVKK